jgi:hypothetical protein
MNRFVDSLRVPMTLEQEAIQAVKEGRAARERAQPELARY